MKKKKHKKIKAAPKPVKVNKKKKKGSFWKFLLKIAILALVVFVIWQSRQNIINYIESNQYLYPIYEHISEQIIAKSLIGLMYASFIGGLFFVSLPVEALFFYYLQLGYDVFYVIGAAMIGNMLGMIFNYGVGRLLGIRVVKFFLGESFNKFERWVNKAGAFVLLIGNVIPFPIEPLALVFGSFKYNFKKYLFFTFLGKLLKFVIMAIIFFYLSENWVNIAPHVPFLD